MTTPRRRFFAIAALAVTAAAALPAVAAAAPTVVLDWSVPARTDKIPGVRGNPLDDRVDVLQPSWASPFDNRVSSVTQLQFAPAGWPVDVDACDSYSGERVIDRNRIASWAFSIAGQPLPGRCRQTIMLPAEGAYPLTVTVTDVDGDVTSEDVELRVRDLLVASIGDSYGSGEGVQPYADNRCDRSKAAAPTQAALRLERGSRSSVTYLHLACSGAKVAEAPGERPGHGGLLTGFKGADPRGDEVLQPQVDELRALAGTRRIDALLISIGGNDIGFSSLIKSCLALAACHEPGSNANRRFDAGIDQLGGLYDALAAPLAGWVAPERTYLVGYPDPTHDENGEYCRAGSGLTMRQKAYEWADQTVARQLRNVMRNAARRHDWNWIEASDAFERHGYCAERPWFTHFTESFFRQFDTLGTFHPNAAGQDAMADSMVRALRADLAD